jgi:hypothetical protein
MTTATVSASHPSGLDQKTHTFHGGNSFADTSALSLPKATSSASHPSVLDQKEYTFHGDNPITDTSALSLHTLTNKFAQQDGVPFGDTLVTRQLSAGENQPVSPEIVASVQKGIFQVDGKWTCYRRNYFNVTCAFKLKPEVTEGQVLRVTSMPEHEPGLVSGFLVIISAVTNLGGEQEEARQLVQHTPKKDKATESRPGFAKVSTSSSHTFERIQFMKATMNNGKRRAQQQYFSIVVELWAELDRNPTTRCLIAQVRSLPLVVRGRSPGHYEDNGRRYSTSSILQPMGPMFSPPKLEMFDDCSTSDRLTTGPMPFAPLEDSNEHNDRQATGQNFEQIESEPTSQRDSEAFNINLSQQPPLDAHKKHTSPPRYANDIDKESNSSSISSVFDSYSRPSISSASSVADPRESLDKLTELLLRDAGLKALCIDGFTALDSDRFNRNLRRLLKHYAVDLRNEAKSEFELGVSRFVRARARDISGAIRRALDQQGSKSGPLLEGSLSKKIDRGLVLERFWELREDDKVLSPSSVDVQLPCGLLSPRSESFSSCYSRKKDANDTTEHCRSRLIKCIGNPDDPEGRCFNCIDSNANCTSFTDIGLNQSQIEHNSDSSDSDGHEAGRIPTLATYTSNQSQQGAAPWNGLALQYDEGQILPNSVDNQALSFPFERCFDSDSQQQGSLTELELAKAFLIVGDPFENLREGLMDFVVPTLFASFRNSRVSSSRSNMPTAVQASFLRDVGTENIPMVREWLGLEDSEFLSKLQQRYDFKSGHKQRAKKRKETVVEEGERGNTTAEVSREPDGLSYQVTKIVIVSFQLFIVFVNRYAPIRNLGRFSHLIRGVFAPMRNAYRAASYQWHMSFRPKVRPGHRRIEWKCDCGEPLWGDFDENQPEALNRLSEVLQLPMNTPTQSDYLHMTCTATDNSRQGTSDRLVPSNSNQDSSSDDKVSPQIHLAEAKNTRSPSPIVERYLELCVNTGEYSISLAEIEVSTPRAQITNDGELFRAIKKKYDHHRGFLKTHQLHLFKPVAVHFVQVSCEISYPRIAGSRV